MLLHKLHVLDIRLHTLESIYTKVQTLGVIQDVYVAHAPGFQKTHALKNV